MLRTEMTESVMPTRQETVLGARGLCKTVDSGGVPLAILHDVGFEVRKGESVAIVGASGSGKSTLLGLLARRLAPTAGRIALDGRGLESLPLDYLRRQVAFVTQDSFLFATSIG